MNVVHATLPERFAWSLRKPNVVSTSRVCIGISLTAFKFSKGLLVRRQESLHKKH